VNTDDFRRDVQVICHSETSAFHRVDNACTVFCIITMNYRNNVPDLFLYPLSYGVPVRERYGSTLLPATREQHDQNCTQSH
jgi:hypothetical protein